MSLLDDASLLVTPNAEKEGKLYSIIPTNGNGDFSVTRATTATRVNAAGLVELVPYNLVTYSEQFDNAAWTKNAASVTANSAISPSGIQNADTFTADGTLNFHIVSQSGSATSGVTYTHSIYAKKGTNNFIQLVGTGGIYTTATIFANFDLNLGVVGSVGVGATATITDVGNGWFRCTMTATATSTTTGSFIFPCLVSSATSPRAEANTLTTSVFLWGAQLVEGTSALDYQMTETRLNIPRLDYSLGSCPNILLEPQRTNLLLRSEEFDNIAWTKINSTITANSATSPSGVQNADNFVPTGASAQVFQTNISKATSAITYTTSLYIKSTGFTSLRVFIQGATNANRGEATFNLTTIAAEAISSIGAFTNTTASISSVGNGWFRCVLTTTSDTSAFVGLVIRYDGTANSVSGFNLWGAQLEAGAYATSYIPTTSASVTRNGDALSRTNIFTNNLITASGGTWFVDFRNNRQLTIAAGEDAGGGFELGNVAIGSATNAWKFRRGGGAQRINIWNVIGGTSSVIYSLTTDNSKVAIKWNGATADVFVNGVKVVTATSFPVTNMDFLKYIVNAVPCNLNSMALFPTPLTDTQCIALTT
jgi:hypothetical protein